MPEGNDNPNTALGSQGSQEFNEIITTPAPAAAPAAAPVETTKPVETASTSQATQPPPTPSASGPSQAEIIRATAEAVAQAHLRGRTEATPTPAKELSPEEFNRKYNVTRAHEELVTAIIGQDPKKAVAALDAYGQGLVKQAILMAMELSDANLGRYRDEVNPKLTAWEQYRSQQEAVAAEGRFYQFAPDLANERELINEIKDSFIAKVRAGQVKFSSEPEAFKAVAETARTILKKVNPSWGQGGGASQAQTQGQQQGRHMSVASSTGRSGTGQATVKSDAELVFGADAR
jgi:hypothetical protein